MTDKKTLALMLYKHLQGTLTEKEQRLLEDWQQSSVNNNYLMQEIVSEELLSDALKEYHPDNKQALRNRILRTILPGSVSEKHLPAHRIHFLRRGWFRYAAAVVILLLGAAAYLWIPHKKEKGTLTNRNNHLQTDIAPGGNRAVLTLADGTKIILDNAANGNLAKQGNAAIIKLANGQIAYNLKGLAEGDIMINKMTTPKGGQYQLTLPDGSKVWLNAASSITFPATFVGKERNVKLTGEAYFEVTANKAKPFVVDIDGKSVVDVLGTSFNINSYNNEADIKTTLVEGSVRVNNNYGKTAILKPGQQATTAVVTSSDQQSYGKSSMIQIQAASIDQVVAWKNGLFNFEGKDLYAVMRELERWYDIEVKYEETVSNIIFDGKMFMKKSLSFNLESLRELGIKFRLEGKTLIVY